jgi:hypothetical protein
MFKEKKAFYKLMQKYSKYGACDSEPIAEAQKAMDSTLITGVIKLPSAHLTKRSYAWQLYSDMPGSERAAKSLDKALLKVLQKITIIVS